MGSNCGGFELEGIKYNYCKPLRIDNSWHSVICTFGLTSGTMSCTLTYYMSKIRAHFSLSDDVNDIFVRFYFIQILV